MYYNLGYTCSKDACECRGRYAHNINIHAPTLWQAYQWAGFCSDETVVGVSIGLVGQPQFCPFPEGKMKNLEIDDSNPAYKMSKIASTRRLVIPTCNNCGKKMELGQGKTKDGLLYLFWWCLGSLQDDACERNEDVLPEITIKINK